VWTGVNKTCFAQIFTYDAKDVWELLNYHDLEFRHHGLAEIRKQSAYKINLSLNLGR
jgi:hypothetical protein